MNGINTLVFVMVKMSLCSVRQEQYFEILFA